jgi:hypothetical protein
MVENVSAIFEVRNESCAHMLVTKWMINFGKLFDRIATLSLANNATQAFNWGQQLLLLMKKC